MSKIKNNPLLKGLSGMLGDVIVFRESRGGMVMANRPKKPATPSGHQLVTKDKFMEATAYAKGQMLDALSKAEYQAAVNDKTNSAYAVALTDYLKGPRIMSVNVADYNGAIGSRIDIRAIDNFRVQSVRVEIRDSLNAILEQGEAVNDPINSIFWFYTAQQNIAIAAGMNVRVVVTDKPGNATTQQVVLG
jgi:hypothetical protein